MSLKFVVLCAALAVVRAGYLAPTLRYATAVPALPLAAPVIPTIRTSVIAAAPVIPALPAIRAAPAIASYNFVPPIVAAPLPLARSVGLAGHFGAPLNACAYGGCLGRALW